MALSWPKYVMLWLAIAAYSVQAVAGGSGWVICLGGNHGQVESLEHSEIEATCEHHKCGVPAQIAKQHAEDEQCPCTDIAIDDSKPGRVEGQGKVTVPKLKLQHFAAMDWKLPAALCGSRGAGVKVPPKAVVPCVGRGADAVRTIVLLF